MLKEKILKFQLNDKAVPPILLFVVCVSFGLLIPWLGFYWDDWPIVYMTQTQGIHGFWAFFQYDRPFSAWTYILLTPILGTRSIVWYAFVLGLRWGTAVVIWLVLRQLWPTKRHQVFWIALLFAACPLFPMQQVVVAYSQHWICYLFYFLSLYLMLKAIEKPKYFYLLTFLAVGLELVQLFTMEYFIGLELLRPFVLWAYYYDRTPQASRKDVLGFIVKNNWVYFSALIVYLTWRFFFFHLPTSNVNNPVLLSGLLKTPIHATLQFLEIALQDYLYLLVSWIVSVHPLDIQLSRPFSLAVLFVIFLAAGISVFLLRRYRPNEIDDKSDAWSVRLMALGSLAILLGAIPVWVIGRQIAPGGDRFSFAAMFGVCVFWVGLLDWLSSRHYAKIIAVCVFLALAIHTNLYIARAYQGVWEKQRSFYWQLFWRAPNVKPNTAFISDGEVFAFVGNYSTSMGIALLYPSSADPRAVPYWFFNYWKNFSNTSNELMSGTTIKDSLRNYSFSGNSKDSLVFSFTPESSQCLEIFSPQDADLKGMTEPLKTLTAISNPDRISREPSASGWMPPKDIFGSEPDHQWCFYYQKAKLAAQYKDWAGVIKLFQEAQRNHYSAGDKAEYLVFVDAYIQSGDFGKAYDLTAKSTSSKKDSDNLCGLWKKDASLSQSAEFTSYYERVKQTLGCANE